MAPGEVSEGHFRWDAHADRLPLGRLGRRQHLVCPVDLANLDVGQRFRAMSSRSGAVSKARLGLGRVNPICEDGGRLGACAVASGQPGTHHQLHLVKHQQRHDHQPRRGRRKQHTGQ
jgi:hypothetical protein